MTIALAAAGVVLGLPLLDHIILGDPCRTRRGDPLGRYVSFREAGLMPAD